MSDSDGVSLLLTTITNSEVSELPWTNASLDPRALRELHRRREASSRSNKHLPQAMPLAIIKLTARPDHDQIRFVPL